MRPTLMVVEDDEILLDMLADALELSGFTPVAVNHPSDVFDLASQNPPDLFLIDIMLPTMSGIEVAQQLRDSGFARTPMIAMSASALMVEQAAHSGFFQAALRKPDDFDSLYGHIQRLLEQAEDAPRAGRRAT